MNCIHVEGQQGLIETMKLQSSAVKKIVAKCVDSSEDVDLSNFGMTELPEDIFLLIKSSKVKVFDVSFNVLSSIPVTISSMSRLTKLNLASNNISTLPRELAHCQHLQIVNISCNNFIEIPDSLWKLQSLKELIANNNFISNIDEELLSEQKTLKTIDLKNNPISNESRAKLQNVINVTITLSEQEQQDWEDLSI